MVIDGAFLKLPEVLLAHEVPEEGGEEQCEATLTNYLAMGVLLELSARNVQSPMDRVHVERRYPLGAQGAHSRRADPYVDLQDIFRSAPPHYLYGIKPCNWVEVKFLRHTGAGDEPRTANAGKLASDLLSLCLFVPEDPGAHRLNARYLVALFGGAPRDLVAFSRNDGTEREWLRKLLTPGRHERDVLPSPEVETFTNALLGSRFSRLPDQFRLKVTTRGFFQANNDRASYHGYLVRILDFSISVGDLKLEYSETSQMEWTDEHTSTQKALIDGLCS